MADETTRDALFGGRVALSQPARGYRTNVDALLLASFACADRPCAKHAFDLGAGVGAVALGLLHLGGARRVTCVEVDPVAAKLASCNMSDNGWADRASVLATDVRHAAQEHPGEADLVVVNPPYVEPGRGRAPAEPSRARGRSGELRAFVDAARALAGHRARVCFVYPAHALTTLLETLRAAGLEAKRLRPVHATSATPARVVLVEAVAGKGGGLTLLPPLVEREGAGYSAEVRAILEAEGATRPSTERG